MKKFRNQIKIANKKKPQTKTAVEVLKENKDCLIKTEEKEENQETREMETANITELLDTLKGSVKEMIMTQR